MSLFYAAIRLLFEPVSISIAITVFLLLKPKWFFVCIPLLPLTGWWVYSYVKDPEMRFFATYVEFCLAYIFFIRMVYSAKLDKNRLLIILMSLCSLPGLLGAGADIYLSVFLSSLLLLSSGVYDHLSQTVNSVLDFRKNRSIANRKVLGGSIENGSLEREKRVARVVRGVVWKGLFQKHYVELAVCVWIVLHFGVRFYFAEARDLDPVQMRAGAIWGTNHLIGILILLLPFVRSRIVFVAVMLTFLFSFSRGAYAAGVMYFMAERCFVPVRERVNYKWVIVLLTVSFIYLVTPEVLLSRVGDFWTVRLSSGGEVNSLGDLKSGFLADEYRTELQRLALTISEEHFFMGIGLGGFSSHLKEIGYPYQFSNAHNLYLTVLAEGGILLTLLVVIVMGYLMWRSFKVEKSIFVALVTFCFYGIFSGQIYEASTQVSLMDFYYLLFIWCYLEKPWRGKGSASWTK
jgi:hypothetical protein